MNEQRPNQGVPRRDGGYSSVQRSARPSSDMRTVHSADRQRHPSQAQLQRERIERAKVREKRRRRRMMLSIFFVFVLAAVIILASAAMMRLIFPEDGTDPKPSDTAAMTDADTDSGQTTEAETDAETEPLTGPEAYGITFISDLSEYEEYMDPADRDAYLTLVNKTHSVDRSYVPEGMTDVADTRADGRATQQMLPYAAKALEALYIEMRANNFVDVSVTSAYRSYDYQSQLFENYVSGVMNRNPEMTREEAEAEANTYSARPGTSEHQTGLCCDMHNLSSASTAFAREDAYAWLVENCWKFGFILRYPEDKTEITGYIFEPWHYRYVGRYHAKRIHDLGICFEEYIELLEQESTNS